ncbi:hypothetical protein [Streptomyces sp. NPDC046939]|uniref:hypothetical protein n=1 Tax=Streptomyces sp. NPDC046939 TaxID=3155376 RepID=UPI003407AF2B
MDVYRDIVEVVADASGLMQAKQIVSRTGLLAASAKIEGTRGKLKRLVERGWLTEDRPGRFSLAHRPARASAEGKLSAVPPACRGGLAAPACTSSGALTLLQVAY